MLPSVPVDTGVGVVIVPVCTPLTSLIYVSFVRELRLPSTSRTKILTIVLLFVCFVFPDTTTL